ncbi:hypothetical protein BBBF_0558 [Bifidobacterium bifidum ATCC 29521 = JCM 1255 = DSM 20456]|nr:hypothetical protein BBBF_0558 [Bifidobacterium bifidum ATCC 29521 = JCM 1255 = DSM 20456]
MCFHTNRLDVQGCGLWPNNPWNCNYSGILRHPPHNAHIMRPEEVGATRLYMR